MKNLIVILCLLLFNSLSSAQNITTGGQRQFPGPTRTYGDIYSNDQGIDKVVSTQTTADLTLYVTTTGNDSNNCLSAALPCLTPQGAINKVPKQINHKVLIDIGAGNFPAFRVSGFSLGTWVGDGIDYQFTIRGAAYTNFTPATGTGSGTSTGGTTQTLIDAGQGWTVNDLRGKLVYVNSAWLIIRSNDATSLETVGASTSTMSGKAYVIQNWSTVINTKATYASHGVPGASTAATSACIAVDNNQGDRSSDVNAIHITRMQVNAPATASRAIQAFTSEITLSYLSVVGTYSSGVLVFNTDNVYANTIYIGGTGASGIQFTGIQRLAGATKIFTYGMTTAGMTLSYNSDMRVTSYLYSDNCVVGIQSTYAQFLSLDRAYVSYNTSVGILLNALQYAAVSNITSNNNGTGMIINTTNNPAGNNAFFGQVGMTFAGTNVISNNTGHGLVLGVGSSVRSVTLTGTGNGGYGIYAKLGAKMIFNTATTLTGALGDIKVGGTVASYAVDYAVDLSYVLDVSDGTVVKRSDAITF